ncbi:hypothetical protein [Paraburkholderia acidisoli]|uniref:Uncharacterized protein n=1 Tax=Paraburkholderia acidisoli TaxID=2571748 RepID=A0A7Z2GP18_9BURK|nr:hypothetical protein [Paraburkholderia acidisoli]QGZ65352.1 hypothetical protein FAZ98_26660 [Paraburkholderia acidisoli]
MTKPLGVRDARCMVECENPIVPLNARRGHAHLWRIRVNSPAGTSLISAKTRSPQTRGVGGGISANHAFASEVLFFGKRLPPGYQVASRKAEKMHIATPFPETCT